MRSRLHVIVCGVLLVSPLPLLVLLFQLQDNALDHNLQTVFYMNDDKNEFCCPKVYLYDPKDILQRVRNITQSNIKLTDLDPLNRDEVMYHHFGNSSLPEVTRIPILTEVTRWLPDIPNRPLIRADRIFDDATDPGAMLFYSKDYVHAFHLRLAVSGCLVANPGDAELFIVPMSVHTDHPYGKKKGFQDEWDKFFSKITDFQKIFQHYTAATAPKHVIFSSSFGHSRHSVGLWSPPYQDPHVHLLQRVALGSEFLIQHQHGKLLKYLLHMPKGVISAPFSTLLTYPQNMFNISAKKTLLVSSFQEIHGQAKQLRILLDKVCDMSIHCWNKKSIMDMHNMTRSRKQLVGSYIKAKTKSTFCLEPEGDWPTRQSMVQDVLLTCIPVFFTPSYTHLWTPFWGNFIVNASIELDATEVLSGKIDVIETLKEVSVTEIKIKQDLLRQHRQQLLYLHMNHYVQNGNNFQHKCQKDAANILLHELKRRSNN